MTIEDFYKYFYTVYCEVPFAAQLRQQANNIFHLRMEVAKLKKQLKELNNKKED
jgi:hypothetical protein